MYCDFYYRHFRLVKMLKVLFDTVTAVMRDVTHSLARSREALRVKKYMCSIEVENRFNARLTSSFIL